MKQGFRRPLFLPQKPYLPAGSLRQVLLYPYGDPATDDKTLQAALDQAGLGSLKASLDQSDNWSARLSPGEQQRINFARILLQKPDAVLMDEATAALDEAAEAELFHLFETMTNPPAILSIGHRK